jgi:putative ATP-dependent endonuclease of the OLD family
LPTNSIDRAKQITIRLTFGGLTPLDKSAFAEYLTYVDADKGAETTLIITWVAKRNANESSNRRYVPNEWRTGVGDDGPLLDAGAKSLLTATYLRPLRDAERAMSAGRGSRLSQILQHTKEIKDTGASFDHKKNPVPDPSTLSILGLGDYASYLLGQNKSVHDTRKKLNDDYLAPLSFAKDPLTARIDVGGNRDDAIRLRQLLEKLEVTLAEAVDALDSNSRGLGSNNLLFMACELLLLASENEGFPILLIEEPEAHLHPQRQLRLMSFLREQAAKKRQDGQQIQIVVTTHSPNLASEIKLDDLVLVQNGRAFPLSKGNTLLSNSDYTFLERFLDVTKANLFFAKAVMIVEGDAENILLPVIGKLLKRDFHDYGVSLVNVGGVGLGRYARIFMRANHQADGIMEMPVACITDMDVMPDCAPWIIEKLKPDELLPPLGGGTQRKWRVESDFPGEKLAEHRSAKREKASAQCVDTFVSDKWTLEYDLAYFGLGWEVWLATSFAIADDKLNNSEVTRSEITTSADIAYKAAIENRTKEEQASIIYARLEDKASKPITAQYLADILETTFKGGPETSDNLRSTLPPYLVSAIEYVTEKFPTPANDGH